MMLHNVLSSTSIILTRVNVLFVFIVIYHYPHYLSVFLLLIVIPFITSYIMFFCNDIKCNARVHYVYYYFYPSVFSTQYIFIIVSDHIFISYCANTIQT